MRTQLFILGLMLGHMTYAQTFSEKISKELTFEKPSADNSLVIANVNGSIRVTAYEGNKILLEVDKFVHGKTESRLQEGKQDVQLGIIDLADTLILYVQDGCNHFGKNQREKGKHGWREGGWRYQSDNDCHATYDYKMDFTVKVPASLHLIASTINNGDVIIEDVKGVVTANNINGSVRLTNLQSEARAHTINGDVDIVYAQNPRKDCSFYTLNGDINALFQPELSANMSFESFNGSLYTNIQKMENLPLEVLKASHGDGIKYKINGSRFLIGTGGPMLDFETFNGNVYIKEKK